MAIILFIFIIFPCHCAVNMYKIMILQKNHLANFHQNSHWSYCWNVIDSLFKWSCSIDCRAHIIFFKTKNCSNDDIFISCDDRIGKMLHNICMSTVAMSLRWASRGPWASCCLLLWCPSQNILMFSTMFSTLPENKRSSRGRQTNPLKNNSLWSFRQKGAESWKTLGFSNQYNINCTKAVLK